MVMMLAAALPLASAFAPSAGLHMVKLGSPRGLSSRRHARLTELKASFTGLADTKNYPLAPTVTTGPKSESEFTVPEWRKKVDLQAWGAEIRALEKRYRDGQGEEDVKHLNKMLNWTYILYAIGLATAGFSVAAMPFGVNPISAFCLSTAICMVSSLSLFFSLPLSLSPSLPLCLLALLACLPAWHGDSHLQ